MSESGALQLGKLTTACFVVLPKSHVGCLEWFTVSVLLAGVPRSPLCIATLGSGVS